MERTPEHDRAVAFHEAGHAQLAVHHERDFEYVTVDESAGAEGHIAHDHWLKDEPPFDELEPMASAGAILSYAETCMAGHAAERLSGITEPTGCESDFHNAVCWLSHLAAGDDAEAEAWANLASLRAEKVLRAHWAGVTALAECLLRERTVTAERALAALRTPGEPLFDWED